MPVYKDKDGNIIERSTGKFENRGSEIDRSVDDEGQSPSHECENTDQALMDDPVVGWIVVIKGPGQGNFLKLGYGRNSIGRSNSNRVSLDFGDTSIAHSRHAVLTYDTRQREFFIQQGYDKRMMLVNKTPLLQPTQIESGARIDLGETRLMFVALCSKQFDWIHDK